MNALAPPPTISQVTTEDGMVLLDDDRGRLYGLNRTASAIWRALADGHSVEQASRDLAARFDNTPDRIRADVETLVAQLRDRGLLTREG
ncbi:lasso peptide biosynthesis PqqD family chaperone [Lentzea tibetensis]|uniref:Lasso peptide biosynthesis PqqD family chaperone n=1 Tax=Lentzea tibetensis TaxID=2591470 RepID=A0A563EHQ1_9PSEU|nr:lasso peptide biosynthesis PqqD family chaperone [Lentzea tibetensis]TWP46079.1 lasso peptide biosynthesis PqqD family chaperone [Lentzea tibetensis]